MWPTVRMGRKASFSVRTPRIHPAAIPISRGDGPRKVPEAQGKVAHEGPDHVDLPVGEGDEVHGAEDDDEAYGHQGVEAALGQAVDQLLQEHRSVS